MLQQQIIWAGAVAAYALAIRLAPSPGNLWDVPAGWVLPHLPVDPAVARHLAAGVGSLLEVEAALSFVDYSRAALVWDEAHEANLWFDFDRAMDAALAEFRASDTRILHAHRQDRCTRCAHPYVDEPTGEYRVITRRHLGPSALVGAV